MNKITQDIVVKIDELKPHPQNYRSHPDDQLKHIVESIQKNGIYRRIVIAKDNTILAGHGVVKALKQMEIEEVPCIKLDIDPEHPAALKILTGDNEMSRLADIDDRMLTEILKVIKDGDETGLLGTGFDEMMLANLLMVTRPSDEIAGIDEASQWVGMPSFENINDGRLRLIISFNDEDLRKEFVQKHELRIDIRGKKVWSTRWPWTDRQDKASVSFVSEPQ